MFRRLRKALGFSAIACTALQSFAFVVATSGVARSASSFDAYAQTVLASVPVAYYRLSETSGTLAVDDSGNALNGKIGSGVTLGVPSVIPCCTATAEQFSGTGSGTAATIGVPANPLFQATTALSLEAAVTFASTPVSYSVLFGYGTDSAYAPYMFYVSSSGKLVGQLYLSGAKISVTAPTAFVVGNAYHIALTYDGTMARLYVNGTQVATRAASGTLLGYDATHGFAIGDDGGYTSPLFKGTLQHVAVYARALSASEITTHYSTSQATVAVLPSPTATPVPTATATGTATPTPSPTATPTSAPSPTAVEAATAGVPRQEGAAFLARHAPDLAGRRLLALEAEDHYLRIHTVGASSLVLLRLRDATEMLGASSGWQPHRSFWVARGCRARAERRGQGWQLVLENGLVVPVSRAALPAMRAAGIETAQAPARVSTVGSTAE